MSFTDTLNKGDFKTEKRLRSKYDDVKSEEKKVERKKDEKKSQAKKKEKKEERKEEKKTKKVPEKSVEEKKDDGRKTPMQVTVAKALETINVNPVALLVSKMIDQQSLVVKLLTEARESRRFEPERTEEMGRMRDKVRHLEKQLRFLEVNLDRKTERGLWKTESTQTEYGIDHSTNTADVREPKIQIPLRNRPTCTIS